MEIEKILQGKIVQHKKLGTGVIGEINDSYMMVRFEKNDKISRFVYPDAFECFLKLEDVETKAVVDKHLRIKKIIIAQQERRKKQELQKIDDELKLRHKEEMLRKQKAAMAKVAREKCLTEKKKILA